VLVSSGEIEISHKKLRLCGPQQGAAMGS
jgi:hypothetical protein